MTDEALVHFWPGRANVASPCGVNVYRTLYAGGVDNWSEVTCPACRLEQPMDARGNPERGLAPEVSRRLLAERLAKIAAVEDEALEEIRHFTTLLKDALALRARLSASLAALDASVVPEEGTAPSTPQKSAGRVAFRVRPGFETVDGHRYISVPCEVPEEWHRLPNEGPDRLWASGPYLIRAYPYTGNSVRYHVSRDVDGRLTDFAIGDYHTPIGAKDSCKINARGEQSFNWA